MDLYKYSVLFSVTTPLFIPEDRSPQVDPRSQGLGRPSPTTVMCHSSSNRLHIRYPSLVACQCQVRIKIMDTPRCHSPLCLPSQCLLPLCRKHLSHTHRDLHTLLITKHQTQACHHTLHQMPTQLLVINQHRPTRQPHSRHIRQLAQIFQHTHQV